MEKKIKIQGKVKLCTCGHSKTLPYCDDSHREVNEKEGTSYKSLKIKKEGDEYVVSNSNWEDI